MHCCKKFIYFGIFVNFVCRLLCELVVVVDVINVEGLVFHHTRLPIQKLSVLIGVCSCLIYRWLGVHVLYIGFVADILYLGSFISILFRVCRRALNTVRFCVDLNQQARVLIEHLPV